MTSIASICNRKNYCMVDRKKARVGGFGVERAQGGPIFGRGDGCGGEVGTGWYGQGQAAATGSSTVQHGFPGLLTQHCRGPVHRARDSSPRSLGDEEARGQRLNRGRGEPGPYHPPDLSSYEDLIVISFPEKEAHIVPYNRKQPDGY
jgi:hypothetical protein